MNRFFIQKSAMEGQIALLTGDDVKHICTVLRLTRGDEVILCDGEGTDYAARIEEIQKDRVTAAILCAMPSAAEPRCKITLYQGLPKAGKIETIVQKCVELGVAKIVPVAMERSVVKLSPKEFEKKLIRYQRVAEEAAKQSRRGIIPPIGGLTELDEIDCEQYDAVIVAYEEESQRSLKEMLLGQRQAKNLAIVIGPEGGFNPREIGRILERGAKTITLGKRILRTETAGMALLAMTLYELEGEV